MKLRAKDLPLARIGEMTEAVRALDRADSAREFVPREFYSGADVAALLGMSVGSLLRNVEAMGMPLLNMPGSRFRRIGHADLMLWLEAHPDFAYALREVEARSGGRPRPDPA